MFDLQKDSLNHDQLGQFFSFSLKDAILTLVIDISVSTNGMPKLEVNIGQDHSEQVAVNVTTTETLAIASSRVGAYNETAANFVAPKPTKQTKKAKTKTAKTKNSKRVEETETEETNVARNSVTVTKSSQVCL